MTQNQVTKSYQIEPSVWLSIETEVGKLLPRIQRNEDLTPDDVKEVRRLVSTVDAAAKNYNTELTAAYKNYKKILSDKLEAIGYGVINNYIVAKRKEQQDLIALRMNDKIDKFTEIVKLAIDSTTLLKRSNMVHPITSQMMSMFPKINSGAANKDISDWAPIQHVVTELVQYAEAHMNELYATLPATSNVALVFGQFFTTGDRSLLNELPNVVKQDQDWLMNKHIASQLTTESDVVAMIAGVATDAENGSLEQIKRLITIWEQKQIGLL